MSIDDVKDNEKRRQRYAEDPKIREQTRKRMMRYRERLREQRSVERKRLEVCVVELKHKVKRPMRPRKFILEVDELEVEVWMYSTGALAHSLSRSSQTVRLWEKNGVLPTAMYRDDRGRRMYTQDQVEMVVGVFEKFAGENAFAWKDSGIPEMIKTEWANMPAGVKPKGDGYGRAEGTEE